jgi:hypothetical protein
MVNYTKAPGDEPSNNEELKDGFNKVKALCCTQKMVDYAKKLITAWGYKLCHEGGLIGTILYYDCITDDPANDYESLTETIFPAAAAPDGKCPWLVGANEPCEERYSTCVSHPGTPLPPCDDDYVCCSNETGFETSTLNNPSTSNITKWDCKELAGAVQLIYNEATVNADKAYDVSVLDNMDTSPTYKSLWQIPLSITSRTDVNCDYSHYSEEACREVALAKGLKLGGRDGVENKAKFASDDYTRGCHTYTKGGGYEGGIYEGHAFYGTVDGGDIKTKPYPTAGNINEDKKQTRVNTCPKAWMNARMNAAALNPVDSLAYAVVSIHKIYYIVRFGYKESTEIEYIAKLKPLYDWSSEDKQPLYFNDDGSPKNNIFVGSMTRDGTYYFGGVSIPNNGLDILKVQNIAAKTGYYSATHPKLPTWGRDSTVVDYARLSNASSSDIAIASGSFDGQAESEWLFMLRGNDFRLLMAKLNTDKLKDADIYLLSTTEEPSADPQDFGAAWTYQNSIYFARNNGDGVYHVRPETIDLVNAARVTYPLDKTFADFGTYKIEKSVSKTPVMSQNNDGLNCRSATPPFPGACDAGHAVDPLADGKCPEGSKQEKRK